MAYVIHVASARFLCSPHPSCKLQFCFGKRGSVLYGSVRSFTCRSSASRHGFEKLKTHLAEIADLESLRNLAVWDQSVMMPANGAQARGRQLAAISRVIHAKRTSDEFQRLVQDLSLSLSSDGTDFSAPELATIREAIRDLEQSSKMPVELESRAAVLGSKAHVLWVQAKASGNFQQFAPALQEWVELRKEMAAAVNPQLSAYDYCLNLYEPGMTSSRLDGIFSRLKSELVPLISRIRSKASPADRAFLQSSDLFSGRFSAETQRRLSQRLAEEMGFSFDSGRLDEAVHPFTMGVASPTDVRLTTRFLENDLSSGILATLHEGGHGLYEQGRQAEFSAQGLPVSKPRSLGIHESQSLLWERHVGLSLDYWEHYWPTVLRSFSSLPKSKAEQFHRVINEVKPSLIRVDADEATYHLHVLLRYEIEKGLLEGSVAVQDVPALWNAKMEEYLGIVPGTDSDGCLQDIHWSAGLFGYFPTYTLGALYAAQIFEAAELNLVDLKGQIRRGSFSQLREWLQVHIHEIGSLYASSDETVEKVTGRPLDPTCFLSYLKGKYHSLYNLEEVEDVVLALK